MSEKKAWEEDVDAERDSPPATGIPHEVQKPEREDTAAQYQASTPNNHTSKDSETPHVADVPPNGGYGWVCTVACGTINAHTWGLNSSYGVFLAHYLANDTFPGASYLEYAFVGSLSISCAMLVSPLATFTTRIYGTRFSLLLGVALETASLIGASFAKTIWQLFLSQGICFGLGMGFMFVASVGIVPQWFTTRRSLANGFSTCGSGLGGLIYSLATGAMIPSIGLAWTFRVLGIVACVVNTICSLLLRDRNKAVGSSQLSFDHQLFKRPEYLLFCGYGWFSILAYVVLIFSLANYANDIGLSASQAAIVSALFNLGQAIGRPPIGYFSDSIGRINMAGLMTLLSGILALLVWVFAKSYGVLIFYALVGGTVAGTFWATVAPVSAEVVGLKGVPSALNLIWLVIVLPCTFSEPIALEIVAGTGRYIGAQLFTGFMYVAAAICLLGLRGWKIGEVEAGERVKDGGGGGEGEGVVAETVSIRSRKAGRKVMLSRCWQWKKV